MAPTTVAPTTAAPTTTSPSTNSDDAERAERAVADGSVLGADTLWTVGGGFALVVLVLAACGLALAVWALFGSRASAPTTRSPAHPAVRSRQRAERIAAAAGAADETAPVPVDTQQS